jgi:HSP20 family molecular chaperone IbpA
MALGPFADIFTTKGGYQIQVELPGVKKNDISIDCEKGLLNVTAVKNVADKEGSKRVHSEREFGTLKRSFNLGGSIEVEKIEAVLADGVLTLNVPKKESARITIK